MDLPRISGKRKEGGEDDEEEVGSVSEQTEDIDLKIPDTADKVDGIQPKTKNIDKGQSSKVAKREESQQLRIIPCQEQIKIVSISIELKTLTVFPMSKKAYSWQL